MDTCSSSSGLPAASERRAALRDRPQQQSKHAGYQSSRGSSICSSKSSSRGGVRSSAALTALLLAAALLALLPCGLGQAIAPAAAAAPAATGAGGDADDAVAAASGCGGKPRCFVVKDFWPVKSCKAECSEEVCSRGWGAWQSLDVCCSPGVAFPEGCGQRLKECWVVESFQTRTCIRDDRKCLQGYGLWPSQTSCCAPGAAFPTGCRTDLVKSEAPCWVVDTYFPARLCRASTTLCGKDSGVQSWENRDACCSPGAAFSEGCSAQTPQTPCWVVDSYWPLRRCRRDDDLAVCNRGWGVYQSKDICCAPNVAFPEGCSPDAAPADGLSGGLIPGQLIPEMLVGLNGTNGTTNATALLAPGAASAPTHSQLVAAGVSAANQMMNRVVSTIPPSAAAISAAINDQVATSAPVAAALLQPTPQQAAAAARQQQQQQPVVAPGGAAGAPPPASLVLLPAPAAAAAAAPAPAAPAAVVARSDGV